jgi:hypothetical protein
VVHAAMVAVLKLLDGSADVLDRDGHAARLLHLSKLAYLNYLI